MGKLHTTGEVIGTGGSAKGFGEGLWRKAWLSGEGLHVAGARGPLSGLYEAIEARLGNHDVLAGLNGRLDMLASIIFHTPDHDEGSASILEPEVTCHAHCAPAPVPVGLSRQRGLLEAHVKGHCTELKVAHLLLIHERFILASYALVFHVDGKDMAVC